MCSFIFTNRRILEKNLAWIGELIARRGPDYTHRVEHEGFEYVHYLLSITGEFRPQPFCNNNNDQRLLYNGQIYNYLELGSKLNLEPKSDGDVLLPLYQTQGVNFISALDGEFAVVLVDHAENLILASTDCFGTKPIWYAIDIDKKEISIASYASALLRLGFSHPVRIPANTTVIFNLKTKEIVKTFRPYEFSLVQKVEHYDYWMESFEVAIKKRTQGVREKLFMGLSSGYDSGCIAAAVSGLNISIKAYSVLSKENKKILKSRRAILENSVLIKMSTDDFVAAENIINMQVEPFELVEKKSNGSEYKYNLANDAAARGMVRILQEARANDFKIFLSGQGADEITSDYGFMGRAFAPNSELKGVFPEDLTQVFPWPNFYGGYQTAYLHKEEHVGGAFGIESRYPFLDRALVQAFLNLKSDLKNSHYKAPLRAYLLEKKFPFDENKKIGFCAHKNLKGNLFNKFKKYLGLKNFKNIPQ